MMSPERDILLSVSDLTTSFDTDQGLLPVVDGVSFDIERGQKVGLVGESGSGKTVAALSILRLLDEPPAHVQGHVMLHGKDLLQLSEREMQPVRGQAISMVFQEPMTSLNPVFTVGSQIVEAMRAHRSISRRAARQQAIELLRLVGIGAPQERFDAYPHQLSGGMRQRVMIAMAMCCEPELIIADEPTTALDVTVQAQILDKLEELRSRTHASVLLITHDLAVVASFADRVLVMHAGRIVEQADVRQLFRAPGHPYTRALLRSSRRGFHGLDGPQPTVLARATRGCQFAPHCDEADAQCTLSTPAVVATSPGHLVRCHHARPEQAS